MLDLRVRARDDAVVMGDKRQRRAHSWQRTIRGCCFLLCLGIGSRQRRRWRDSSSKAVKPMFSRVAGREWQSCCHSRHEQSARAWYKSEAYRKILPLRTNNVISDMVLVDGVPPGHAPAKFAQCIRRLLALHAQ